MTVIARIPIAIATEKRGGSKEKEEEKGEVDWGSDWGVEGGGKLVLFVCLEGGGGCREIINLKQKKLVKEK